MQVTIRGVDRFIDAAPRALVFYVDVNMHSGGGKRYHVNRLLPGCSQETFTAIGENAGHFKRGILQDCQRDGLCVWVHNPFFNLNQSIEAIASRLGHGPNRA